MDGFMDNDRKYTLTDYTLDNRRLLLNETLFHNANGYIGIRYSFEEGYPEDFVTIRGQYINGFYDTMEMAQPERLFGLAREKQIMLNISDTQTIRLNLAGEDFSMFTGTLLSHSLTLDMDRGCTFRNVHWRSPGGKEIRLKITRMASLIQLPLFTIDYEIDPINFDGEIIIESVHTGSVMNYTDPNDPRLSDEPFQYLTTVSSQIHDGDSYIVSTTSKSELEVCSCVRNVLDRPSRQDFLVDSTAATCRIATNAEQGEKIRLIKYCVFCGSIRYDDCTKQAGEEIETALATPLETLYEKQRAYLEEFWNHCYVQIKSRERDDLNKALQFNMFQLIQSVGKDMYSSITPKGLSGEGYEGHYFWDTEMFIEPFFTATLPEVSKDLITYRHTTLEAARQNAKIMGHRKGALYPWRTITGQECSGFFPAGSAQYHINGDIAYAIVAYYLATKDIAFILDKGAEIIFETARLWLDTGNYYNGQFHINDVTGPDEYTCIVNNNYYTNVLAQYHLRWAVKFYNLLLPQNDFALLTGRIGLVEEEIEAFEKAAENMYLPYDPTLGINPQDDSFLQKEKLDIASIPEDNFPLLLHYHPLHLYRHQVCKQADTVMAHFILEDAQDEETIRRSLLYYEGVTTHDSSLSQCIFCIVAARLGMEEKAYRYFCSTVYIDLEDQFYNTKDGIHMANMGGNYMAVVYGFGGYRLKESGIRFSPVLPTELSCYRFKISYEDSRITVNVVDEACSFKLETGNPKHIQVYGQDYFLEDTLTFSLLTKEVMENDSTISSCDF